MFDLLVQDFLFLIQIQQTDTDLKAAIFISLSHLTCEQYKQCFHLGWGWGWGDEDDFRSDRIGQWKTGVTGILGETEPLHSKDGGGLPPEREATGYSQREVLCKLKRP